MKLKYFVMLCISIFYMQVANAQNGAPARTPMTSGQAISFSMLLGAAESQCVSLYEIINTGWPVVKEILTSDLVLSRVTREEATYLIERAYLSGRTSTEQSGILKSCDQALSELYKFNSQF